MSLAYAASQSGEHGAEPNIGDVILHHVLDTKILSMLRELAEAVETLTLERPLVLVVEDLHWSDFATLDWLAFVARRRAAARLLVLGTYRPADAVMRAHPVHTVAQELQRQARCTELVLHYLSEVGVVAYLAQRFETLEFPEGLA